MPMKRVALVSRSLDPFSLPAADDQCGRGNRSNCMGILGAIRLHHETLLARGFFSLLSSHQRASSAGLPSATLLATLWSI